MCQVCDIKGIPVSKDSVPFSNGSGQVGKPEYPHNLVRHPLFPLDHAEQ